MKVTINRAGEIKDHDTSNTIIVVNKKCGVLTKDDIEHDALAILSFIESGIPSVVVEKILEKIGLQKNWEVRRAIADAHNAFIELEEKNGNREKTTE